MRTKPKEGNHLIISRLFRRAAGRRKVRRMRQKTATARRVSAQTDAMLTRTPRRKSS